MIKDTFLKTNWLNISHHIILLVFGFYFSFYSLAKELVSSTAQPVNYYAHLLNVSFVGYIISLIGLSYYLSRQVSRQLFLKTSFIVISYLIVSYWVQITQHLNDKRFDIWSLTKNQFYQFQALPSLLIILVMATLIKILVAYFAIEKDRFGLLGYQGNTFSVALILAVVPINDIHLLKLISSRFSELVTAGNSQIALLKISGLLIVLLVIFATIIYVVLNALKHLKSNKPSFSVAATTSLFLALVFNYTFQYGVKGDEALLGYYVFPGATLFQIVAITLVALLAYVITNRYWPTTFFLLILGTIISVVNDLKESMRSEPLLVTDFVWLQELGLVTSFVKKSVIVEMVVGLAICIVVAWYLHGRVLAGKLFMSPVKRASAVLGLFIVSCSMLIPFSYEKEGKILSGLPIISALNNDNDINWLGFSTNARYKSLAYVWTRQVTKKIMEKPTNYSQETIASITQKYQKLAEDINKDRKNNIADQTVIYLLSESLSDPDRVSNVTVSHDVLPNIKAIKNSTTAGLMQSDSYGGGTANMEFQTLTSLPFYNFSSSVSVLYSEVFPKMAKPHTISEFYQGKNRIAMHPASANNFNRKTVYSNLGFSKFLALSGSKDKFKNIENVGLLTSDKTVYNNILSLINPSESQFFSVITMQNHIPWSSDYPEEIVAEGKNFTEEENHNLTSYARLLSFTDKETRAFLEKLTQINKPITVVFYGDHLPGLYPDSAFNKHIENKYLTDYFIWSNGTNEKKNHPLINSSDFTAALFEHTDSKVSPYYALLTEVLNKASVDKSPDSPEVKAIQNDLKNIQYDVTIGKGYLLKHKTFFKISR
ncbi:TPA: sulfatase-like hydrolase/transferase [Streptococcus pyogenes]|nr:sulfatase-like hydrolase/transferase [Streptococcus pyogenes]HEQ2073873.1 sulfatase-like hydrolase/transferase [Streptococcus pyogenes]HEQ2244686.1 sulfatase-like hydrolase/transferase [Streptococcus pyogenes]HEQ2248569.1 sulfatase-like hydrolase/transferase [Streptococcus pyogenes]